MPCLQLPPTGNQSALNLPPRNALREAKAPTCHLWDVPEHPQIHGMAMDGVKGLSCCTAAVLNLGKAFSPAAKPNKRIWHRSSTSQAISRTLPVLYQGTAAPYIPTGNRMFSTDSKRVWPINALLFEWSILSLCAPLCLPSDSCWFSFGEEAASETAETIWCKGRHNNKIQ